MFLTSFRLVQCPPLSLFHEDDFCHSDRLIELAQTAIEQPLAGRLRLLLDESYLGLTDTKHLPEAD